MYDVPKFGAEDKKAIDEAVSAMMRRKPEIEKQLAFFAVGILVRDILAGKLEAGFRVDKASPLTPTVQVANEIAKRLDIA